MPWLHGHRRSVLLVAAALVLAGLGAAARLPVALFPQIAFPRVQVSVDAGDRTVDAMVVQVTRIVEQSLRAVPGVTALRSTSSRGTADVSVGFDWGTDMVAATLQVESALNRALPDLPPGARFEVRRMDPTIFPVLGLSLTSTHRDAVALRDVAYLGLRPLLAAIPGVAQVEVLGGRQAEIQVLCDPARLAAAGLTLADVAQALASHNVSTAIGRLEDHDRLYLTLTDDRLGDLAAVEALVLRSDGKSLIRLRDVADVVEAAAPEWTRVTAQGTDAVLINLRQAPGANTVDLVAQVRAALAGNAALVPADVRVSTFYDQSELITAAAGSVRDAILIGAVLAGVVLLVFLRDLRTTLVVGAVLPAVLASTSLLLRMLHQSFNMMTLGGMAAAVGLVVDDAVVMVEHLARRATGGRPGLGAAAEMWRPLAGSSAATVIVFLPLAFLDGVTGGFFRALALTVGAALVFSFLFAAFAVPLLAVRGETPRSVPQGASAPGAFRRFTDGYVRVLGRLLQRRLWLPLVAVGLVVTGGLAYRALGSGFMPAMDEGGFVLDYRAPPGTALPETDRLLRQAEALVTATPEVDSYSRRTGLQLGGGLTEASEGDLFIHLRSGRRRPIEDVMADLRGRIEQQVPGLTIETAQLMEDLIGDLTAVPQPIEVKLFATDRPVRESAAHAVVGALGDIAGVVEVQDGLHVAGDALQVHVDPVRAALEGLDPEAVSRQLEPLLGGLVVTQLLRGEKQVPVRLWSPPALRGRTEALGELRLHSPDGQDLPLRRIAEVTVDAGQPEATRENLAPMVAVSARLEGRDLGSAMGDVRRAVAHLALPPSVRVEFGGLYSEQRKSFAALAAVFVAAVLLVSALLMFLYERAAVVAAILAVVLLAACGVFLGLWVAGIELNISSLIGLTMTVGIVTEMAIFLVSELDLAEPLSPEALLAAGRTRLRPILMTSLIAVLALSPLVLGLGAGAEMQRPLAAAIIAGILCAAPLVLFALPALLWRFAGSGRTRPP